MDLDFALAHGPKGFECNPECIFFNLETYQETSVSDILSSDCRNWFIFRTHGRTDARRTEEGQTDVEVEIVI